MKVSSNARSLNNGDVLYAKEQFFEVKDTPAKACMQCCLRNKHCADYIGDSCPTTRYYMPAQITPEIERALDIALLQGEVSAGELR